jgi:cytoskeletal protein RodZ
VADLDLYPEEDLYEGEEEVAVEGEGSNRTFIILVGALGGLLALAVCVFAVWAFVLNPRANEEIRAGNHAIETANAATITAATAEAVAAADIPPTNTAVSEPVEATVEPTATQVPPTATPLPATDTPAPEVTSEEGEAVEMTPAGEVAEAAATATSRPTATRGPTATPGGTAVGDASKEKQLSDTGLGALSAGVLGLGLLVLLAMVRRMRRPV